MTHPDELPLLLAELRYARDRQKRTFFKQMQRRRG